MSSQSLLEGCECAITGQEEGAPLTSVKRATGKAGRPRKRSARTSEVDLPFADSVGYQIRATHRALQRFLQFKIEPHGIAFGMWYFLPRALA